MSPQPQSCPACGAALLPGAAFCRACGALVDEPPASPEAAPLAGASVPPGSRETRYEAPTPRAQASQPPSGPPPGGRPAQAPAAAWPHAGAQPAGPAAGSRQYVQSPGPSGPPPVVPQAPIMIASGAGTPRRGTPPWVLVLIIVVVVLALAGGAIAIFVLPGGDNEDVGSSTTTPTPTATASPSPSVSPSPTAPTEAEHLTRYTDSIDAIVVRWNKLYKKLNHVIGEAHHYSDYTWPPAGRKVHALTSGYNGITSAIWAVETPDFLRPATQSALKCARLEHELYDLIGDWFVNNESWGGDSPNGREYERLRKAANKAWKAYLKKVTQEEGRLGVSSD